MDYRSIAQQIYDNIGGRQNIVSAAACVSIFIRNYFTLTMKMTGYCYRKKSRSAEV